MPKMYEFPLCQQLEPTTQKYFINYKAITEFKDGYYQRLERLLKYLKFQDKPIDTYSLFDVEELIISMWENGYKIKTTNAYIGALRGFRKFLIEKCSFSDDFLNGLEQYYISDKTTFECEPFSLKQLNLIREYNKSKPEFEFIFEVFFQLGIDKKDISICSPKNCDQSQKVFSKGKKRIFFNSKISDLLDGDLDIAKIEKVSSNVDYFYFRHLSQFLINEKNVYPQGSQITYSEILKSHHNYIVACPNPNCREMTENICSNWVLLKTETDSDFRLYCKACKGQGLN
jgi:hypothetical protein